MSLSLMSPRCKTSTLYLSSLQARDPNSVSVLQLPPKHCLVQYLKTSRADKSVKLEEKMAKLTIHSCSTPKRKNMLKLPINII